MPSNQLDLMKRLPEDEIVVKANELVTSQIDWTIREYRIFVAHVSKISRDDDRFEPQSVRIKELCRMSGIRTESLYEEAKGIADRLTDKKIRVEKGQKGSRTAGVVNVYASCAYREECGELVGRFTEEMGPFLLRLKDHFTMYYRRQALSLRSIYSVRFYEILKRYEYQGGFKLSVEELRTIFNLHNKYRRFRDLKRRVIERARAELDEKADVSFEYSVLRDGQKPVAVEFEVKSGIEEKEALPTSSQESEIQDRYLQKFDRLSENERRAVREQALEVAKQDNPGAGEKVIESQMWRHVRRIVEERYF